VNVINVLSSTRTPPRTLSVTLRPIGRTRGHHPLSLIRGEVSVAPLGSSFSEGQIIIIIVDEVHSQFPRDRLHLWPGLERIRLAQRNAVRTANNQIG